MEKFELTLDMVKDLKCSLCKKSLSVPPISIISEGGSKYKCGRCDGIITVLDIRDVMYENIAKYMMFPCIYKECDEKVKWSEVKEHEKKCPKKTMLCPKLNCDVEFMVKNIVEHFKDKHKESFHTEQFLVKRVYNYYNLDLLEKDGKSYIIIFNYDDVKYGISVCSLEADDHQFELLIEADSKKYMIKASEQRITPFEERVHCFKCITGVCKNECHFYKYHKKGVLRKMTTRVDRDSIKRTFGSGHINFVVNITEPKGDTVEDLVDDLVIDEVKDEDDEEEEVSKEEIILQKLLKCSKCSEYMHPPIHQCINGHAICSTCKADTAKCPSCEADVATTRNYALEEIASGLKLSCLNSDKKVAPLVEEKEITCPKASCQDKINISAIGTHFKEKHIGNFHWNNFCIKNVYSYFSIEVLERNGKTYIVLFDFDDMYFGINVCSIGRDDGRFIANLTSRDRKYALSVFNQKIVPFDENQHCFKCVSGTCKEDKHMFRAKRKGIFKRMTTKLDRESAKRLFESCYINLTINIVDAKSVVLRDFSLKKDKLFRQLYECPICKDYMSQPISQCLAGHSFCHNCRKNLEKCPSCEGSIENTRNYALESIVDDIDLPCQFEMENCRFRGSVKRIANHENECPLKAKKVCVKKIEVKEENTA